MKVISYTNLICNIYEEYQEIAVAMLSDYPFQGIEQKNDQIIISFYTKDIDESVVTQISGILKDIHNEAKILEKVDLKEKNWNEEYESRVKSVIVSDKIGIAPTWRMNELDQEIKIEINPKMSFGTGEHATTRLVAKMQEKYTGKGEFWIDAGTGTGILAIVAEKLGASKIYAFDNNEWSINNSIENIKLNNCNKIDIEMADIDIIELPKADGIVANIFTNLIVSSMPKFSAALARGKHLICSGIMVYDKEKVISAAEKNSFKHIEHITEDEWIALVFEKI
jgi:ribosomal protein L11 methyltransferase